MGAESLCGAFSFCAGKFSPDSHGSGAQATAFWRLWGGRTISPKSGFIMFIRTDGLVKTNLCQGIPISQQSAVVPIR